MQTAARADAPSDPPTDEAEVHVGAGLVSVARGVGAVLTIATTMCVARALDRTDFAVIAAVHLLKQTAQALGTLGLQSSMLYYRAKLGATVERGLAFSTAACLLGLALPVSGILYLASDAAADFIGSRGAGVAMAYLAVLLLADFPASALPDALLSRKSYQQFFWITILYELGTFAALVIPAFVTGRIDVMLSCFVAVAYARLFLTAFYIAFVFRGPLLQTAVSIRKLFTYGVPLALSAAVGRLNQQVDKYLIAAVATAEVFAVYTVGALELPIVQTLAYSVTQAMLPALIERHHAGDVPGFLRLWHTAMSKVALVLVPAFVLVVACADSIVVTLFSEKYRDAAVPFAIYAALLPLRLCAYGGILRALGRTRPVLWAALFGLLLNAALTVPLYRLAGLAGPALATVITQLAMIVWLLAAIREALGLRWAEVFPARRILATAAVALAAAPPLVFVTWWAGTSGATIVIAAIVYGSAYLLLARRFQLIGSTEWLYIQKLLSFRPARPSNL